MEFILSAHIIGAGLTAIAGISSFVVLKKNLSTRPLAIILALLAFNQIITGILLLMLSPTASITTVCLSGLGYLSVVGFIEYKLVLKTASAKN